MINTYQKYLELGLNKSILDKGLNFINLEI